MRRWLRACGVVLLSMELLACGTIQKIDSHGLDAFSRTGRFALTVQSDDVSPQAVQGGFAWLDEGQTLRVNLTNPMGTVLAQISITAEHAVLRRSDGSQEFAQDPDALATHVFGQRVPLSHLRTWLRGQVSAQAQDVQRSPQGHVLSFQQDGWVAQFSRFDAQGPRLLRLHCGEGCNTENQQIVLRLVIDSQGA